ncbi:unnamed protein product [Nesidiocoris tenuis]|uniref:Uncharacterized protein n=1 Tax=Nesidiocoris tenuis TaxID=355587 RepID=A0A6H5H1C3_9HEMI|nr:unnamed protein product [Nesidiocoris tenuis]
MVRLKVKKTCRLLVVIIGALVYAFWRQGGDWVDYQTELSAEKWIKEMELVRMLAEREIHRRGQSNLQTKGRPWYMAGGTVTPSQTAGEESGLWPEQDPGDDRITNQLMFRPPRLPDVMKPKLKTILLSNGLRTWTGVIRGGDVFSKCPVKSCKLTLDKSESRTADAILFKDKFVHPGHSQINRQVN